MPDTDVFDEFAQRYDEWFEKNRAAYESELGAVKSVLPADGDGLEIGVGGGRFASRLGIKTGIDPSANMRGLARERGVNAVEGVAERLPFENCRFDFAMMVTVICFLDDVEASLREAHRVLKNGGALIIGFIEKNSPVGKSRGLRRSGSLFYRRARFYSADEVACLLKRAGFVELEFRQTLFGDDIEGVKEAQPVKDGRGEGSFVVIKAKKGVLNEQG